MVIRAIVAELGFPRRPAQCRCCLSVLHLSSSFQISTAWLSFPALARANTDADSKPSGARRLEVAKPHEDSLAAEAGDAWDWFSLQAPEAGTLVIVTRAIGESADLVLEAFLDGKFGESVERSDQDLQGGQRQ